MKKTSTLVTLSMGLFALILFGLTDLCYAQDVTSNRVMAGTTVNVTSAPYSANGSDTLDDTTAIQTALDLGKTASAAAPVTIVVPAGTYYISQCLQIYSNTNLQLDSAAKIVRSDDEYAMLSSPYDWAGGYDAISNSTISGGVWDGNVTSKNSSGYGTKVSNLFYFWHGKNLTFSNMTLKNVCGDHFIELAGIKDSVIDNVIFKDYVIYTEYGNADSREAIQLDFCNNETSGGALPFDNTKCSNISVNNCTFDNVISGVGSHHAEASMDKLTVNGCTFNNIYGYSICLNKFTNATITNNIATTKVSGFLYAIESTVKMSNNVASYGLNGQDTSMVHVESCTSFVCNNNNISGGKAGCLYVVGSTFNGSGNTVGATAGNEKPSVVFDNASVSFSGNTVNAPMTKTTTVYAKNGSSGTISQNVVKTYSDNSAGIHLDQCKAIVCENNTMENSSGIALMISNAKGKISALNNKISNSGGNGIFVYNCSTGSIEVTGNTISASNEKGICVESATTVVINNNVVTNAGKNGISAKDTTNLTISGNSVSGSVTEGIYVKNVTANISSNTIRKNGTHGIFANGRITIDKNKTVKNTYFDIIVADTDGINSIGTVTNNEVGGPVSSRVNTPSGIVLSGNVESTEQAINGLAQGSDGNWYYYVNDVIDTSCNDIKQNSSGWWYVRNGQVDFSFTGVAKHSSGEWYISGGKVQYDKNGLIEIKSCTSYYGASATPNVYAGWYYFKGGQLQRIDSIESNSAGWWYVKNGQVDFSANTVAQNSYGWWYVRGGKVDFSFNGVAKNPSGEWYISGGKVDFSKNGVLQIKKCTSYYDKNAIATTYDGWYYFSGGQLKRINSVEKNTNGWWCIVNGQVDFSANTVAQNSSGWWYVRNGKVDFSFNGIAKNSTGEWYISGGKVMFDKKGVLEIKNSTSYYGKDSKATTYNGWYYFKDGKLQRINSVESNSYGWWYIKNGQVDFSANTVAQNSTGWWYIKNGKVDFGFEGIGSNENGSWYLSGGKVQFSANMSRYQYNGHIYLVSKGKATLID